MNDLQYKILKMLKDNNGMQYIEVINNCDPLFTEAKSALNVLNKKNLVDFSSHNTTSSFVSLTDEGVMEVLSYKPDDEFTDNFEANHQTDTSDHKLNVFKPCLDRFKLIIKKALAVIVGVASIIGAIEVIINFFL